MAYPLAKLKTADIDRLETFYVDGLGFAPVTRLEAGEGARRIREVFLAQPGAPCQLALIQYIDQPLEPAGAAIVAIMVADIDAAVAAVIAHGGQTLTEVVTAAEYALRLVFVTDPEGHELELMQPIA